MRAFLLLATSAFVADCFTVRNSVSYASSFLALNQKENLTRTLKVAYVTFVSDIKNEQFKDVLAVQAYGLKQAAKKSSHQVELLVLAPEHLPDTAVDFLKSVGFAKVIRKPLPVSMSEIDPVVGIEVISQWKRTMGSGDETNKFAMADETIKYWGLALTDYDRVLVLDSDVMVLDPMDELMERSEDFVGTFDHGLDKGLSTIVPPTQGGFLLFRPNADDFKQIQELTKEGDFRFGWKDSAIGYCYGGTGPDGLLAYYFHKDALADIRKVGKSNLQDGANGKHVAGVRMFAANRLEVDVVLNEFTRKEISTLDHKATVDAVKSIHFTGDCIKPWQCSEPRDYLCKGMTKRWWEMRSEYEASKGLPQSPKSCMNDQYHAISLQNVF